MEFKMLTMETVEKLVNDLVAHSFMQCVVNGNLYDQDNVQRIASIAERLGVDSDEIFACIWLSNLIEESNGEFSAVEAAMVFAEQHGIVLVSFINCIEDHREDSIIDASQYPLFSKNMGTAEGWQADAEEEREAFLAGMNLFEYREYIADLLSDADLQSY